MKRSTLTLSILTALLVSACGGSSSNDEQTKDPTPPKVTPTAPTNPSTPSTGKTPTTGNKDNAGTSGSSAGSSSSSSSDPTPPISSGSAPSGGKPIVVTPTNPEPNPDPDESTDPDEPTNVTPEKIATLEKEIKAAEDAKGLLAEDLKRHSADKGKAGGDMKKAIKALIDSSTGILKNDGLHADSQITTIQTFLEYNPDKAESVKEKLNEAIAAKTAWAEAKRKERETQAKISAKKEEIQRKTVEKELAEAKKGLQEAEIPAEKDYFTAKKEEAESKQAALESKFENDALKLKVGYMNGSKTVQGQLEQDIGALEDYEQKDLAQAILIAKGDKKTKLEEKKKEVDEKIEKLEAEKASLETKQKQVAIEAKAASDKTALKTAEVNKFGKYYGNRGVSGEESGYSADNLLNVEKAKLDNNKWFVTFKGENNEEVELELASSPTALDVKAIGDNSAFGSYGKIGEKDAFLAKPSDNSPKSIYGYIDKRFFSVGEVTKKEVIEKITDSKQVNYEGNAVLKHGDKDLVAKFEGHAVFADHKYFEGKFSDFGTYATTGTGPVTAQKVEGALKDAEIKFAAKIDGNKFKTVEKDDEKANVYGYFYGKDSPTEVGGLVEYNDVFHGSFGGAKKSSQ